MKEIVAAVFSDRNLRQTNLTQEHSDLQRVNECDIF